MRALLTAFLLAFVATGAQTQHSTTVAAKSASSAPDPQPSPAALIARAKPLELDTPYVAPPGDPLVHHAAGFAKVMCSAVFITGLDPEFAAENVGYFTAPYEVRAKLGKPVVDREHKQVQRHGARRSDPHGRLPRRPGVRDASGRQGLGQLQTGQAQDQLARCLEAGLADGRRAAEGAAPLRTRHGES